MQYDCMPPTWRPPCPTVVASNIDRRRTWSESRCSRSRLCVAERSAAQLLRNTMAAEKMDHRAAANCAFIGAALFLLSAILFGTGFGIEFSANVAASETPVDMMNSTQRRADFDSWRALDVNVLKRRWEGRIASQTPHLLAELTAAVAWFTTLPAVSSAALVAGGNSRSATRVMYNCFVAIAAISTVDFTFQAGTVSMTDWLATWPVMDANHTHDGGFGALQALELDYQVPPLTHGDTHCRLGPHG